MPSVIPERQTQDIINLLQNGRSYSEIARSMGITKSSISRIKKAAGLDLIPNLPGRKSKISKHTERLLARGIDENKFRTIVDGHRYIRNCIKMNVSLTTTARAVKQHFDVIPKIPKPLLTPANIQVRLNFCKKHKDWTCRD